MPQIQIEQGTFERLQHHAQALVDTSDTVLTRILDFYERGKEHVPTADRKRELIRLIDPDELTDLTHTKVLSASLAGQAIPKPNWRRLLEDTLVIAMEQLEDLDEVRRYCGANIVQGRKEVDGFRYLGDVDISVQGLSANEACRSLIALARSLSIAVDVTFVWRLKEDALHPGEKARLRLRG